MADKLEQLLVRECRLKARIQRERAKATTAGRRQRTGRLVAWGVAVEQMLASGEMTAAQWRERCQEHLTGRTLDRALAGLAEDQPEE